MRLEGNSRYLVPSLSKAFQQVHWPPWTLLLILAFFNSTSFFLFLFLFLFYLFTFFFFFFVVVDGGKTWVQLVVSSLLYIIINKKGDSHVDEVFDEIGVDFAFYLEFQVLH